MIYEQLGVYFEEFVKQIFVIVVAAIYDSIVDKSLLVRRFTVAVTHLIPEGEAESAIQVGEQLDLFTDYEALEQQRKAEAETPTVK